MARAPRGTVPKTTGQALTRGIYQKGRALGGNISVGLGGGGGGGGGGGERIGTTGTARDYTKQAKLFSGPPENISFGDTMDPAALTGPDTLGTGTPPKSSINLSATSDKKWAK